MIRLLWSAVLTVALLATGCASSSGPESAAVNSPRETTEILPAPTDSVPGAAASRTDADGDPAPVPAVPAQPAIASLSCLDERQRVAQLLLALVTQPDLGEALILARSQELGGIGFLGSPDDRVGDQLAELQQASELSVMVASDEEGGQVQRFANLLGPMPSAASTAETRSPQQTQAEWLEYGSKLAERGIDVVFGPVVDVGGAPGIGSRSFGDDPTTVTAYARAVADGLSEAGVMPVFKHFPGHGRASGDSHFGLPVVPGIDELWTSDLLPYVDLVGDHKRDDAGVMVGHLSVPGLSGDLPTSLSADAVNGLLKGQIGFGGLVFTDAMNMGAIVDNYGSLDALVMAFRAGSHIAILGSLAEVGPAIDHLLATADADPGFAALLDMRVRDVLAAKGHLHLCAGAS